MTALDAASPLTLHANGLNVYRSNITGSHTSLDFDTRFTAVSGTEASFG